MTAREREAQRRQFAVDNGYRPVPVPNTPAWAGINLTDAADEQAFTAAQRLRGINRKGGKR